MTRSDFSFTGAWLFTSNPLFTYDARLVGDVDAMDYGRGRINLLVNYEAVIGSERRRFDVDHGNYTMAVSSSYRAGPVELAGFFHHVSRHLSDRFNPAAISWNVIGGRAAGRLTVHGTTFDGTFDLGRAIQRAFVDYTWTANVHLTARHPIGRATSLFGLAEGGLMGVDREKNDRGRQCGGRLEGGLHVEGTKGAVEVFAGYERRFDAFPTSIAPVRFFTFGFRVATK